MYAAPAEALEAFWRGLQEHFNLEGVAGVPDTLDRPGDLQAHWRDPDLLLSQTCGYPLMTTLHGSVRYVGTPAYRATGCQGGFYSSAIVVRVDDPATDLPGLRGRRAAYNSRDSQSGYNALRALIAPLGHDGRFFAEAIETGSHRSSMAAVRTGAADVAAIDAVTFALLRRDQPDETAGLRVLHYTDPVPGLPLITAWSTADEDLRRLRSGWQLALADPELAEARTSLLLDGFEVLPVSVYDIIPTMAETAAALGYPDLA